VSFADSTSIPLQGLVGRNAPDFRLEDGTRLGELMQDGRGVVLDFRPANACAARRWAGPAGSVMWQGRRRTTSDAMPVRQ
jgi:hypothetical protein